MVSVSIFTVSGLAILVLLATKKLGERRSKPLLILSLISKGDKRIREVYHKTVHFYFETKEKCVFLYKKQIPMRARNIFNKTIAYLKEKREEYLNNMRDSKLLKKPDGMSEFLKNMSDIEKGNGEINDVYMDGSQNVEEEVK